MKYKKLNDTWNAEPNAPEVKLIIENSSVSLIFYINTFLFENFNEGQKGILSFKKVHKFSFNNTNDEGYYSNQYRYKSSKLPWGEFYLLDSDWSNDFHKNHLIILPFNKSLINHKHFIFFLKDNTFECVAESFEFNLLDQS